MPCQRYTGYWVASLILIFAFVACMPAGASAKEENPKGLVFDFGMVEQGEKVHHVFQLTNSGSENLVIKDVKTSCGCTAAKPSKTELKPGETADIKVTFSTEARRGPQVKGITVFTNDPSRKQIVYTIKGEVYERLSFAPPRLLIKAYEEGKPVTQKVVFTNNGQKALQVTDVRPAKGFDKCLNIKLNLEGDAKLPYTLNHKAQLNMDVTVTAQEEKRASRCIMEVIADGEEPIQYKAIIWRKK